MATQNKTYTDKIRSNILNLFEYLTMRFSPLMLAQILNRNIRKSAHKDTGIYKKEDVMTLFSSQAKEDTNNVVSLWQNKDKINNPQIIPPKENSDPLFREMMLKNASNQQRLKQERLKANQQVLRSYRIKK